MNLQVLSFIFFWLVAAWWGFTFHAAAHSFILCELLPEESGSLCVISFLLRIVKGYCSFLMITLRPLKRHLKVTNPRGRKEIKLSDFKIQRSLLLILRHQKACVYAAHYVPIGTVLGHFIVRFVSFFDNKLD